MEHRAVAWLLVACCVLLTCICGPHGTLASEIDREQTVQFVDASGRTREVTMDHILKLTEEQQDRAKAHNIDKEEVEDKEGTIEEIEKDDPRFALHIHMAKTAFAQLQANGYADQYELKGFSELNAESIELEEDDEQGKTSKTKKHYRLDLKLRAQRAKSKGAKALSYEVHLLLDRQGELSVLAAWELTAVGIRGPRLGIKPSERVRIKLMKRAEQKEQAKRTHQFSALLNPGMDLPTILLTIGVSLIIFGGVLVWWASSAEKTAAIKTKDSKKTK